MAVALPAEARPRRCAAKSCEQAPDRTDILNVGGFSDAVFVVVSALLRDDAARFVAEVEAIEL